MKQKISKGDLIVFNTTHDIWIDEAGEETVIIAIVTKKSNHHRGYGKNKKTYTIYRVLSMGRIYHFSSESMKNIVVNKLKEF
jgi:hypothetical protein